MVEQLDLWALAHARRSDPLTSHAAARQAKPLASEHARRILTLMQDGQDRTSAEVAQAIGLQSHQCNRRTGELIASGHLEPTGSTRSNPDGGRQMRVLRAAI